MSGADRIREALGAYRQAGRHVAAALHPPHTDEDLQLAWDNKYEAAHDVVEAIEAGHVLARLEAAEAVAGAAGEFYLAEIVGAAGPSRWAQRVAALDQALAEWLRLTEEGKHGE